MQILLRSQNTHLVEIAPEDNVQALRAKVAEMEGMEASSISLICAGSILEDNISVSLLDSMPVDVNVTLKGGKVHGSLARAGKVRGQTPKVEINEEKKKKKTGRCKRRIQYNRRFVNVVESFGKKRGPNSNQPASA